MKRWVAFVVVVVLAFSNLQLSAQITNGKSLLWKISGNGITNPSYLFGTIHIMCADAVAMPPAVQQSLTNTKKLYLEVDINDPALMSEMMAGLVMKDSSTLENLTGSNYDTLATLFKKTTGLPLSMFNKSKPFMVLSMLYPTILGCTPESFEAILSKMAKTADIKVFGLETLQDQLNVFEKIPYKVQATMLGSMLMNLDSARHEFAKMLEVYKSSDVEALNKMTVEDETFGSYEELLLKNRNLNWLTVIEKQVMLQPAFFAFGAGHLGGEDGIINLLRKKGFTVTPVY